MKNILDLSRVDTSQISKHWFSKRTHSTFTQLHKMPKAQSGTQSSNLKPAPAKRARAQTKKSVSQKATHLPVTNGEDMMTLAATDVKPEVPRKVRGRPKKAMAPIPQETEAEIQQPSPVKPRTQKRGEECLSSDEADSTQPPPKKPRKKVTLLMVHIIRLRDSPKLRQQNRVRNCPIAPIGMSIRVPESRKHVVLPKKLPQNARQNERHWKQKLLKQRKRNNF
jgi:hypothetical protein